MISFARTLYMNPQILILDEATSHRYGAEEIIRRLWRSHRGAGPPLSLPIACPLSDADQILVLSEGRIVERGRHERTSRTRMPR